MGIQMKVINEWTINHNAWLEEMCPVNWNSICLNMAGILSTLNKLRHANKIIIGAGNGFSPVQLRAGTRIHDKLFSTGHLETNFSEIWINIHKLWF